MKSPHDEIKAIVEERVKTAFPDVIVEFRTAADDEATTCVRVFGAGEKDVERIEDLVFDAEDELIPDRILSLLPMVKTIEITRQYYPELYQELEMRRAARSMRIVARRIAAGNWMVRHSSRADAGREEQTTASAVEMDEFEYARAA